MHFTNILFLGGLVAAVTAQEASSSHTGRHGGRTRTRGQGDCHATDAADGFEGAKGTGAQPTLEVVPTVSPAVFAPASASAPPAVVSPAVPSEGVASAMAVGPSSKTSTAPVANVASGLADVAAAVAVPAVAMTAVLQAAVATQLVANNPAASATAAAMAKVVQAGGLYAIPDAGLFTTSLNIDFTDLTALPDSLQLANDAIAGSNGALAQQYTAANVAVKDGLLQLKVPGGQTKAPILGAQVITTEQKILYGSVRTVMKASSVEGTCHGFFYYKNDNNEIDIEILTGQEKGLWLTNQPASASAPKSDIGLAWANDATADFHEYRIDWTPLGTSFYIDNVHQQTLQKNVPKIPGSWIWNNWSNGDDGWSAGPPAADNIMQIKSIEMYYNVSSSA